MNASQQNADFIHAHFSVFSTSLLLIALFPASLTCCSECSTKQATHRSTQPLVDAILMETMAADDPTAAKAEENRHQHPLMYLHANKTATANNTTHVKREEPQSAARENDKDKVKIMNAINKSSSSKMSFVRSMKSIISIVLLIVVIISLHSTLQTFEVIDNKIATSAILLHHCHSFIVTVASILSKIFYAFKDIILLLIASSSSSPTNNSNNAQVMVMEQFQSRLQKGQQLLAQYKDISGSEMVCKSVANAVVITANERKRNIDNKRGSGGDDGDEAQDVTQDTVTTTTTTLPLSYSSIVSLQLTQEESNLLSKSLSCVAEVNLNLSQQQRQHVDRLDYLTIAKSYLDNALVIDPTDPLIRANVGLTYLLLGTSSSSMDNSNNDDETSVQFVLQSIQHLNVAIGILKSNNDSNDDSNEAVYMAALYNFGLANLALDGFDGGDDHYLKWINTLQSSEEESSILQSSGLFLGNKGASLLQNNKVDDAIVGLTSFVNEFCTSVEGVGEDATKEQGTRRERELCSIARHNLAIAEGGSADEGNKIDVASLIKHSSHDDVQPNITDVAIEETLPAEVESDLESEESGDVDDNNVGDDIDSSNTTDIPNVNDNEESPVDLNSTQLDAQQEEDSSRVDVKQEVEQDVPDQSNDVVEVEVDTPTPQVKTEMQNALAALEKAAEATQQSRLLLTLAKARVSAGDFAGAVDAALKAISAAKTEEETDTSSSYLETLMGQIADEESGVVRAVADDSTTHHAVQMESSLAEDQLKQRHTSLIGERELSTTELQLKLELERLKYKVLEQEMRFAQQQVWNHPRHEFNSENVKALDYKQNVNHVREELRPSPSYQDEVASQNDAVLDDEHEQEVLPQDSDDTKPMQNITSAEEENDSDPVSIIETTEDVDTSDLNDAGVINATDDENQSQEEEQQPEVEVEVEVTKTYGNDPDVIDFDEETTVVEEEVVDEEVPEEPEAEEETPAVEEEETIELPSLFIPTHSPPAELTAHARSYMKMADAYLDKGQYHMASKQFLKVIKKAPDHLPAHLGYATALERDGKSKQISAVALAYGNATRVAIVQGEPVDPLVKAGGGGIAENILRRAVKIAKSAPSQRLETLRILSTHAHTAALASDIYYEIGLEISSSDASSDVSSAKEAFAIANEFITTRNDEESRFHIGSIIELGRLALEGENDANKAIEYMNKAKDAHMEDGDHVKLLVLVGRAHMALGEIEVAISELTRALSLPESPDTQNAHYELAIALSKNNADKHEVDLHFEKALDLGMDPTAEAIESLGERNMSVMRALNRQYYKQFNNQADSARSSEGGILSGGGVGSQSSSIFASQQASEEDSAQQSDPLSLLEQGASAYDANNVMGGAVEAESNLSNLSNRQAK